MHIHNFPLLFTNTKKETIMGHRAHIVPSSKASHITEDVSFIIYSIDDDDDDTRSVIVVCRFSCDSNDFPINAVCTVLCHNSTSQYFPNLNVSTKTDTR